MLHDSRIVASSRAAACRQISSEKHFAFADRTRHSANAFKFELRAGSFKGLNPVDVRIDSKEAQNLVSRVVHHVSNVCVGSLCSRLLRCATSLHPRFCRVPRYTGDGAALAFKMNEEENIVRGQPAPSEHLDSEEVHRCEHFHVGPDKLIPAGALTAFWRRPDPVTAQDIPNHPI